MWQTSSRPAEPSALPNAPFGPAVTDPLGCLTGMFFREGNVRSGRVRPFRAGMLARVVRNGPVVPGGVHQAGAPGAVARCAAAAQIAPRQSPELEPRARAQSPSPEPELRSDRVLADLRGAQHAIEQQVEVMGHLLGALTRPDV